MNPPFPSAIALPRNDASSSLDNQSQTDISIVTDCHSGVSLTSGVTAKLALVPFCSLEV